MGLDRLSILEGKILPNIERSLCSHVFKIVLFSNEILSNPPPPPPSPPPSGKNNQPAEPDRLQQLTERENVPQVQLASRHRNAQPSLAACSAGGRGPTAGTP